MLKRAVSAEGVYELSRIYWSGSWIILLSNRKLMNIFQLLHGHAQNQMSGTALNALEIAFWYISLACSQIQLLVIQTQNDKFTLLDRSIIWIFDKFSSYIMWSILFQRCKIIQCIPFSPRFSFLPKNNASWISLFAVQSEILILKISSGMSNEHLKYGLTGPKKWQKRSLGKPTLPSPPCILCPGLCQEWERRQWSWSHHCYHQWVYNLAIQSRKTPI